MLNKVDYPWIRSLFVELSSRVFLSWDQVHQASPAFWEFYEESGRTPRTQKYIGAIVKKCSSRREFFSAKVVIWEIK